MIIMAMKTDFLYCVHSCIPTTGTIPVVEEVLLILLTDRLL